MDIPYINVLYFLFVLFLLFITLVCVVSSLFIFLAIFNSAFNFYRELLTLKVFDNIKILISKIELYFSHHKLLRSFLLLIFEVILLVSCMCIVISIVNYIQKI